MVAAVGYSTFVTHEDEVEDELRVVDAFASVPVVCVVAVIVIHLYVTVIHCQVRLR